MLIDKQTHMFEMQRNAKVTRQKTHTLDVRHLGNVVTIMHPTHVYNIRAKHKYKGETSWCKADPRHTVYIIIESNL